MSQNSNWAIDSIHRRTSAAATTGVIAVEDEQKCSQGEIVVRGSCVEIVGNGIGKEGEGWRKLSANGWRKGVGRDDICEM